LIKLKPEWAKFVRQNGELIVKIKKSIYGLKESGRLWYEEFMRRAVQYPGIKINKMDPCFINSETLSACVYVDDTLVSGSIEEIEAFKVHMEEAFGKLTCSEIDEFSYLGMHVKIIEKRVELRSDAYVNKLLSDNKEIITRQYDTPCDKELFASTKEENKENQIDKKTKEWYHSTVACLLYVAMRVRVDILLVVVFLATKVHNTTRFDVAKLKRLLGYLQRYPDRFMVLKVDDPDSLVLRCYADASYAIYEDSRKSQTGIFVTLGVGCIIARSTKQKLVAVSSTEAEITALSTMVRMVLGMVQFLVEQGYASDKIRVMLFEDNTSAIQMIKTGRSVSEGTKHISIHKFFIKQHLTPEGLFELIRCGTLEQIANGFTKSITISEFLKFLVDIGMRVKENGHIISLSVLHNGKGELSEVRVNIKNECDIYKVRFLMSDLGSVFEIPVVNQTQVEVEGKVDEENERRSNNVGATNERGMELLHLLRETESTGPVRDIGPVEENRETPNTDNLAEVSSDGSGTNQEGRVLVSKRRTPSSSGANGEGERE